MELGFLSAILGELTFEEVIDFAAENGFKYVELACWPVGKATRRYAGVTHIDMSTLDEEKVRYIKAYLADKGVRISGIGYYPNPLSGDLEVRQVSIDHIKACIVGAAKLGVNHVNAFIGRNRSASMEENMELFDEIWPPIVRFAEEHGVSIGIENCPMYFATEWPNGDNLAGNVAFWREMFKRIPSKNFGLNYDPSHQVWQQTDYVKPIYEFKDRIIHFHVKDAKFYKDKFDVVGPFAPPLMYHSPKLPGQGDIKWNDVIAALNDIRYKGAMILEIEDLAYQDSLEDRKEAILTARDYMKQWIRR